MKKIRVPNVVMLVDILFIFLFIMILNPDKNKYNLIFADHILPSTSLLYNKNAVLTKQCFYLKENKWDICLFPKSDVLKFDDVKTDVVAFKNIPNIPPKIDIIFFNQSYQNIKDSFFNECFVRNAGKCNGANIDIFIKRDAKTRIEIEN